MATDLEKWVAPATSGEVARLTIATRQCMIDLHNALMAAQSGNTLDTQKWLSDYRDADKELKTLLWEVAGFDNSPDT